MSRADEFHSQQVRITHQIDQNNGDVYLQAEHPDHGVIGGMYLKRFQRHPEGGFRRSPQYDQGAEAKHMVEKVSVKPKFQRKGVATSMWNYADGMGLNPMHGSVRTEAGAAWSKKVGEYTAEYNPSWDSFSFKASDYRPKK
jgi:hypothetical protein